MGYASWMVVQDEAYQEFLRREMAVVNCTGGQNKRTTLIARSAELTGCVKECPECGRLYVGLPGRPGTWYYRRESEWVYPGEEPVEEGAGGGE